MSMMMVSGFENAAIAVTRRALPVATIDDICSPHELRLFAASFSI